MPIYRPRALLVLDVPLLGTRAERLKQKASTETVQIKIPPKRLRLESNDHCHADSLSVTFDWTMSGLDPRVLDDATATLFVGNADEYGDFRADASNVRFIGLARDVECDRDSDSVADVTIECVDYTSRFLDATPFGSAGIPAYSQTLEEAWRTIVSQTPGADVLADNLHFIGVDAPPRLGDAVSARFRELSKVPTKPETDAWAVWQQCVGMCGLISYIDLDRVIVTTATNYYTNADPPSFVWGRNLSRWRESRNCGVAETGVGLTSFDPVAGTTIEAVYPPVGDARVRRKRVNAKKVRGASTARHEERREWFAYPGVTQADQLERIAQRVYEERIRQELEGRITTGEMSIKTLSGAQFDLLNLNAGDAIHVGVAGDERQLLASLGSDAERVEFLTSRGYHAGVARLLVQNVKGLAGTEAKFHVKTVCVEADFDAAMFNVDIFYCNQIQIDGSAKAT